MKRKRSCGQIEAKASELISHPALTACTWGQGCYPFFSLKSNRSEGTLAIKGPLLLEQRRLCAHLTLLQAELLPAELAASLGNKDREGLRGPYSGQPVSGQRVPQTCLGSRLQCQESSPGKTGKPGIASEPQQTPVEMEGAPPHWVVMPDLPFPLEK